MGINLTEQAHIVSVLAPTAATSATGSDWVKLENAAHVTFIVQTGSITNSSTVICQEGTSSAGSGATAIAYSYSRTTAAGDTWSVLADATASGIALGTTNDVMLAIELSADDLSDGSPWVNLQFSTAATIQIGAVAILSGVRYQGEQTPTAIS